jgi:hypothetical protein
MSDVLHRNGAAGRTDQAVAARNKARPHITRWLKSVETKIRDRELSDFDGRLVQHFTNYPSANQGLCWAGQTRLARKLGRCERTIRYSLERLESAGLIQWKRNGRYRTNCYVFCIDRKRIIEPAAVCDDQAAADHDRRTIAADDRHTVAGYDRQSLGAKPSESESFEYESLEIDTSPPTPSSANADTPQAAKDGLTEFGRNASATGMRFVFENSEPFQAWGAFRGADGMPPMDVRIVSGTPRRGCWLPSVFPPRVRQ